MFICISISMIACAKRTEIIKEEDKAIENIVETGSDEIEKNNEVDEGENDMDNETQKMMAEGMANETKESIEQDNQVININDYDISIACPEAFLEKKENVTYGELIHTKYYSTTCEKDRNVNVLLPAGYSTEKKYPVLYILHGIFGDEYSMVGDDKAGIPITLGNMMNEKLMEESIVVFPFMYASKTKDQCTAIDDENVLAYDNFVNDLVDDLMPFMEANYSILTGKENTAITGFSMGGRESLAIGFYKPELFGYVGSISAAPGLIPSKDWAMEHKGQFTEDELKYEDEKPFLIMVCCGTRDSVVGSFPSIYHDLFTNNGVEHIWWEIPGSDHGDPAISSGIYNFAKEIFK